MKHALKPGLHSVGPESEHSMRFAGLEGTEGQDGMHEKTLQRPTPVRDETTYTAAKPTNCNRVKAAMTLNCTVSTNGTCPSLSNLHYNDTVSTTTH